MSKAIQQSVRFAASPAELFEMYVDSKKHSAATGGRAKITDKPGASFTAWNGQLHGKNLLIVPNRLVMQSWRSAQWPASDPDSMLLLAFQEAPGGAQVDLLHLNVPEHDHADVTQGWKKYYWQPWKKYLAAKKNKKTPKKKR